MKFRQEESPPTAEHSIESMDDEEASGSSCSFLKDLDDDHSMRKTRSSRALNGCGNSDATAATAAFGQDQSHRRLWDVSHVLRGLNSSTQFVRASLLSGDSSQHGSETDVDVTNQLIDTRSIKRLRWLKLIFMLALLCLTICLGWLVHHRIEQDERDQFETNVDDRSNMIIQSFQIHFEHQIGAIDSLSSQFTSHAKATGSVWPNVTLPDFHLHATSALRQSGSHGIVTVPLAAQRTQWESYAVDNRGWILDSLNWGLETREAERQQLTDAQRRMGITLDDFDPASYQDGIYDWIWKAADPQPNEDGSETTPVERLVETEPAPHYPLWQAHPLAHPLINYNLASDELFVDDLLRSVEAGTASLSSIIDGNGAGQKDVGNTLVHAIIDGAGSQATSNGRDESKAISLMYYPIFDDHHTQKDDRKVVAVLIAFVDWSILLSGILPPEDVGFVCVIEDGHGKAHTLNLDGPTAASLGPGDLHDQRYGASMETAYVLGSSSSTTDAFSTIGVTMDYAECPFTLRVYPSKTVEDEYITIQPLHSSMVVGAVFLFAILLFQIYDCTVQKRQTRIMKIALRSNAIVSSLFPSSVQDRLFASSRNPQTASSFVAPTIDDPSLQLSNRPAAPMPRRNSVLFKPLDQLRNIVTLKQGNDAELEMAGQSFLLDQPIADFFPDTSVLFADIVGFTAWSSQREPGMVFTLLQTLYRRFDRIAKRRHVFKVETIGDCYVACTGLPDPQADHAVRMGKFAQDILFNMYTLSKKLETVLGPDTSTLSLRIGIHSGPVIGGVLSGEKSRFQLFGDTMNTASRMESTSRRGRIQISQSTADLIFAAKKGSWLDSREDKVQAKGLGEVQTYWLNLTPKHVEFLNVTAPSLPPRISATSGKSEFSTRRQSLSERNDSARGGIFASSADVDISRLIDWQTDLLKRYLRRIAAAMNPPALDTENGINPLDTSAQFSATISQPTHRRQSSESKRASPSRSKKLAKQQSTHHPGNMIDAAVVKQLRLYVEQIAYAHKSTNPFHNFVRSCSVSMGASKFLSKILDQPAETLNDRVCLTNPLTQFGVIFATLVYGIAHPGVPNSVLVKENHHLASKYDYKDIAKKHALDVAWEMLLEDTFDDLRNVLFATPADMTKLRQIVTVCIMSTDIYNDKLKEARDHQWDTAGPSKKEVFQDQHGNFECRPNARTLDSANDGGCNDDVNGGVGDSNVVKKRGDSVDGLLHVMIPELRANLMMEQIMQASNILHTMQHWHVYQKWNRRLFEEMYLAYEMGRDPVDPSTGWYEAELTFFDEYVIPLAREMDKYQVFGVAGGECLSYATKNRKEWAVKGMDMVRTYVQEITNEDQVVGGATGARVETTANASQDIIHDDGEFDEGASTCTQEA